MPESLEQLDLLLLTVAKPRQVHQDGIRFQALRYIDPTLAAYVGESVTIRYDPRDMAEIRVYHKDRFLCRAVCQELAGETVSLKDIARARNRRKRELQQVITARRSLVDQVLASPFGSPLSPEPLPLPAPVALPQSPIKRYAQD
jgi:putative transposase